MAQAYRNQREPLLSPPQSFAELNERAAALLGQNLAVLAQQARLRLPDSTLHGKGFTGELIEILLGADAGSDSAPDFSTLGVELKTMPVDGNLMPLESTFICALNLQNLRGVDFWHSVLWHKMQRMLWVFIRAERERPLPERYVAGYYFYRPSGEDLRQLEQDYNELTSLICEGRIEELTAHLGEIVQLRPKAADGTALTPCVGPDGTLIMTRPRGFYLRRSFTSRICTSLSAAGTAKAQA